MLLGIYLIELKIYIHTKTCAQMFIVALFIIAKYWKQGRCPSINEWINKLWYIHTKMYDSVILKNEVLSHKKTCRKLKCLLLSERSQFEKATYYDYNLWHSRKRQNCGDAKKKSVVARALGVGKRGRDDFLEQWNSSVQYCNGRHITLCICQNRKTVQHKKQKLMLNIQLIVIH